MAKIPVAAPNRLFSVEQAVAEGTYHAQGAATEAIESATVSHK
jgi:hypothetical protein